MRSVHQFPARKYLIAGALGVGTVGSLVMGLTMTSRSAHAQYYRTRIHQPDGRGLDRTEYCEPFWKARATSQAK